MPEIDGLTATRRIREMERERSAEIPIFLAALAAKRPAGGTRQLPGCRHGRLPKQTIQTPSPRRDPGNGQREGNWRLISRTTNITCSQSSSNRIGPRLSGGPYQQSGTHRLPKRDAHQDERWTGDRFATLILGAAVFFLRVAADDLGRGTAVSCRHCSTAAASVATISTERDE